METVAKTIQSQATAPVNKTCSLKKNVAVTKASCKHGLWLVDCVNYKNYRADFICLSVIFIEKMLDPFEMCF